MAAAWISPQTRHPPPRSRCVRKAAGSRKAYSGQVHYNGSNYDAFGNIEGY